MGKVIKADASVAAAYAEFDAGSELSTFWVTIDYEFKPAAVAYWFTDPVDLMLLFKAGHVPSSGFLTAISSGSILVWSPSDIDVEITANEVHTVEFNQDSGNLEIFVDGVSIRTDSLMQDAQYFRFGLPGIDIADPASVAYIKRILIGTTRGDSDIFLWNAANLAQFTVSGDVSVVDDPFPGPTPSGGRVWADELWRSLITDTGSGTLTVLDHRAAGREVLFTLGAPASATGQVAADDPEINLPYPDADSAPYLTNNRRLLYMLRREPPASDLIPPYVCRFGGIIMSVEDEAGDAATTRYVAYDPWQLLMSRPVRDPATGDLPGENGLTFLAADNWRWNEIITSLLDISLVVDGEHHIETFGTSYPLVEECAIIASDVTFSRLSVGEAWQQITDTGYVEILLPPIYDPFGSPGKVTQIQVAPKVGSLKADVIMGWDIGGRTVTDISRLIDGTRLANRVAYFAGQTAAPIQSDTGSRAAYGDYFAQQFFPDQEDVTLVAAMAFAQLTLRKNGAKNLNFGPAPERSDLVLRDYGLGDYVAVWASRNLRDPIGISYDDFDPDNPGACGYQRVFSIPIQIDDNGVTKVVGIATADERAGGSG